MGTFPNICVACYWFWNKTPGPKILYIMLGMFWVIETMSEPWEAMELGTGREAWTRYEKHSV